METAETRNNPHLTERALWPRGSSALQNTQPAFHFCKVCGLPIQHPNFVERNDPTRLDRIRGCLLGGAIGDALGAPIEFMSLDAIHHTFGAEGSLSGQLLGTHWGAGSLPQRWLDQLELRAIIEELASDTEGIFRQGAEDVKERYPGW